MKYRSCHHLENFTLTFAHRIDSGDECVRICCMPLASHLRPPGVALSETAEESANSFVKIRAEMIAESMKFSLLDRWLANDERKCTSACMGCVHYQLKDWEDTRQLITEINLSMYPSPCQCKCVYCNVRATDSCKSVRSDSYEKVFDIIDWMQKHNMIALDAAWQVSAGEITIHPYKDKILNLVKNQAVIFYTNCFIFDEKIAAILATNSKAAVDLSIDSGTRETWYKVKGVDNFSTVMDNLAKYFTASVRPGQITLKYIILPGINDNFDDYCSVIEIMKDLKVSHLTISPNTRQLYLQDKEQSLILARAADQLAAMLNKNGLTVSCYFPIEGMSEPNNLQTETSETPEPNDLITQTSQIPPHKRTKFHYNRYRLLSNITFGKLRRKYNEKRKALKKLLKEKT